MLKILLARMVWIICVKKIKIAVEKNKKSQKAPYKTTTQNGASLLEAIVGRRQWCFIFWDSIGFVWEPWNPKPFRRPFMDFHPLGSYTGNI